MGSIEQNRRRNQIVAQRAVEKYRLETLQPQDPAMVLFEQVIDALDRACRTEIWSGHPDNAVRYAAAIKAARELRNRGSQLPLFQL